MSEDRDITVIGNAIPKRASELLQDQLSLTKEQLRVRNVRIINRGYVATMLEVPNLPSEYHGEWVHEHDVKEYEARGFVLDNEFAVGEHSDGTKTAKVGDVVHMITTKGNKEALDEALQDQIRRRQDPHNYGKVNEIGELQGSLGSENVEPSNVRRKIGLSDINSTVKAMEAERAEQFNNGD